MTEDKQRIRPRSRLIIAALLTGLSALVLTFFAEAWSRPVYDALFRLRGPLPRPDQVVVVAVDEVSFDELNAQWPWPRSIHGRLLDSLFAAGAKAVALDILFAEPSSEEEDAAFAAAVSRHPNVVLAKDFSYMTDPVLGYQQMKIVSPDPILNRLTHPPRTGFVSIAPEADGYLRRIRLEFPDGDAFAVEAAKAFGQTKAETVDAVETDDAGLRWINFAGPARTVPTVSYYQALDPATYLPPNYFKDKLVFVGVSAASEANIYSPTADHFLCPFSREDGAYIPGVEVHANAALNVVRDNFISSLGASYGRSIGLVVGFLSALLFLTYRPVFSSFLYAGWTGILGAATMYFFENQQLVIAPVYLFVPLSISYLGCPFIHYWYTYKQKAFIRKAFSTYLAPDLVAQLINNPDRLELGGEEIEGTVIFLDLSGFTAFSERLKPKELIELINRNLGACADVVLKWQGMIDKYIGDCIMAVWGVPISTPDHAIKACSAVCDIQERIKVLAVEEQKLTGVSLSVRVGINSGLLVAGNVGGGQHFNYTVLGNEVNLASRLEGTNKYYGTDVILSESTAKKIGDGFLLRELDVIRVVGQKVPVKIYQLLGRRGSSSTREDVEALFQEGRRLYTERQWEEAIGKFKEVLAISPGDIPSKKYVMRCEEFAFSPPDSNWDGVYQMMSK
ncbi:MAG: adenylate/guanylate cyclase domain-containing protein [Bdellovibrionota bacterium]